MGIAIKLHRIVSPFTLRLIMDVHVSKVKALPIHPIALDAGEFSVIHVKVSRYEKVPESVHVRSTIFSLAISTILLTALCFILNLLGVDFLFPLILLLLYLFLGIIYTLILWNFFAAKETGKA